MEEENYQVEIDIAAFNQEEERLRDEIQKLQQEVRELEKREKQYKSDLDRIALTFLQVRRVLLATKLQGGDYLSVTHYQRDFIANMICSWISNELASLKKVISSSFDVEM